MQTVLIVDDQKTVLLTLEAILKKEGYLVLSCTNSIDAIDKANSEHIDLMITDAIMPYGVNGFNLISTLRGLDKYKKLPIIMLTGKREQKDVDRALSVGANDYIMKPIDPDLVISKVKELLSQSVKLSEFVEAPMSASASVQTKTDIIKISEAGLTLNANIGMTPGQLYRISSEFFKEMGFESANVRVVSCEKIEETNVVSYNIQGHFVGLSEKEMSQLRLVVRSKLLK